MSIRIGDVELPDKFPCAKNAGREALYVWYDPNQTVETEQGKIAELLRQVAEREIATEDDYVMSVESILAETRLKEALAGVLENSGVDPNLIRILQEDLQAIRDSEGRLEDDAIPALTMFEAIRLVNENLQFAADLDEFIEFVGEAHSSDYEDESIKKAVERFLTSALVNRFCIEIATCRIVSEVERALEEIQEAAIDFDQDNQSRLEQELVTIMEEATLEE